PVGIAIAATFDKEIARQTGMAMGRDFTAAGQNQQLGPCLDLCRDPRNGRSAETGGEDPFLSGEINAAVAEGIQTSPVFATAKHFNLVNRQDYRHNSNVTISDRWLMEHYGLNFKKVVQDAGVMSVMNAYNLINGVHCSENEYLMQTILRDRWGFPFYVVSDWSAVHNTANAINAGTDICMGSDHYASDLPNLISSGTVSEATLDLAVKRVLKTKIMAGMMDYYPVPWWGERNTDRHRQICLEAGRKSIILLKNQNNILPFNKNNIDKIALIGPSANIAQLDGFGSSDVEPSTTVSPRQGIEQIIGSAKVDYHKGCDINSTDRTGFAAARSAAADADYVVFVGGLDKTMEGEGYGDGGDRKNNSVELPGVQYELIQELAAVNPNIIVILKSGGICSVNPVLNQTKGLIYAFYPGQEAGTALAEVLFGQYNPAGRLPVSMPVNDAQLPPRNDNFNDDYGCGYRYYDELDLTPEFAFGFGLSYTTFSYSNISVTPASPTIGEPIEITCDITNTGSRAGEEVAQLYITNNAANIWMPEKELKGFERIFLAPGETKQVSFKLYPEDFYYWNETESEYDIFSGDYEALIGGSSDNLPLSQTFNYTSGTEQPDLVITQLFTMPKFPLEGEDVQFYALVKNQGSGDSPSQTHELTVEINGSTISTGNLFEEAIPKGGMQWMQLNDGTWNATNSGDVEVTATIDPLNSIAEGDESNNSITKLLTVYDGSNHPSNFNLAYEKPVTVSSTEADEYSGENINDGNSATRWSSEFSEPQTVEIDLEAEYDMTQFKIIWEAAYATQYTVEVSTDQTNWELIVDENAGNGGEDIHEVDTYGRYIRITGEQRATQYGVSIFEFEVLGTDRPEEKPQIEITSPTNGQVLKNPDNITLEVDITSSTPIKKVDYFNQGMLIGSSDNEPYSFVWEDYIGEQFTISANAVTTENVTGGSP
ncbi:glycoside hydrolase family 3 C-terminal domain-containing protein, partial [Marinilabilia sp.]